MASPAYMIEEGDSIYTASSYSGDEPPWPAKIKDARITVEIPLWAGSYPGQGNIFGSMIYDGFIGIITPTLNITQQNGTTTQLRFHPASTDEFRLRGNTPLNGDWHFDIQKDCGQTFRVSALFEAWVKIPMIGLEDSDTAVRDNRAVQEKCCPTRSENEWGDNSSEWDYDPYHGTGPEESGCDDSENGGGGDDGKQYRPGDYTGGETVDWRTGVGNGGTSACGDEARVEYICIYEYNAETDEWEVWDCGFVTTCG